MAQPTESRWDFGLWDTALWDAGLSGASGGVNFVRRAERVTAGSATRTDIARAETVTPGTARRIDE